jgi:hypothetical protein
LRVSRDFGEDFLEKRAIPLFPGYFCLNEAPIARTAGLPFSEYAPHLFVPAG